MEFVYGEIDGRAVLSENAIFYGFTADRNSLNTNLGDYTRVDDIYDVLNEEHDTVSIKYDLAINILPSHMVLIVPESLFKITSIYNSVFNITTTWSTIRTYINNKDYVIIYSNNKLAPGSATIIDFKIKDLKLEEEEG